MITFTIDGREVTGAREHRCSSTPPSYGDVEIPVFCYEPKLGAARRRLPHVPRRDRGHPEAADRLLDAGQGRHGRPHADRPRARRRRRRSSSSCSSTTRSTARSATRAASARCRTSPSAGAAAARASSSPSATSRSRSSCSPLIAIDRERCILCYRCVRFSQEICRGLPAGPPGARRAHVRRHVRRPPLRRAVQRQHHRAVPGGRADLAALPLPRAPVGHRGRGLGLHALPGAVQRRPSPSATSASCACSRATTTRSTTAGSATSGRFAYQSIHVDERITQPLLRDGGELRAGDAGSARSTAAAGGLRRRPAASARWSGGEHDQRGGLPRSSASCARALGSPRPRLARRRARRPAGLQAALGTPVAAGDGPRPRVRARRPRARLPSRSTTCRSSTCASARACAATASSSPSRPAAPSSLDPNARCGRALRAGRRRGVRRARSSAALGGGGALDELAAGRRHDADEVGAVAALLRDAGEDIVIALRRAPDARRARRARRPRAAERRRALGLAATTAPACSRSRSAPTGAACARSASCRRRPRARRRRPRGATRRDRRGRRRRRAHRAVPAARRPAARRCRTARLGARRWSRRRPSSPTRRSSPRASREHATVVFPAESYAEKEGTSRTPTGACSACARRSPTPARCAPSGRSSPTCAAPAASTLGVADRRHGVHRSSPSRGPVLRRPDARRDRRPRRALAGARRRAVAAGRDRGAVRPGDAARAPTPNGAPARSGRTARSGPRPRSTPRPGAEVPAPRASASSCARRRRAPRARPRRPRRRRRRRPQRHRRRSTCAPTRPRAPPSCETGDPRGRRQPGSPAGGLVEITRA